MVSGHGRCCCWRKQCRCTGNLCTRFRLLVSLELFENKKLSLKTHQMKLSPHLKKTLQWLQNIVSPPLSLLPRAALPGCCALPASPPSPAPSLPTPCSCSVPPPPARIPFAPLGYGAAPTAPAIPLLRMFFSRLRSTCP